MEKVKEDTVISMTGLGYVGLPVALAFADHFPVIAYDRNASKIQLLLQGKDPSAELSPSAFRNKAITFTSNPDDLSQANVHIIAVPTDVDEHKVPDLEPLLSASRSVAICLKKGDYVIYESTVYPGCTEEECIPLLEKISGLSCGAEFKVGYSPERIVPGDKIKTLGSITKIIAACDQEAVAFVSALYTHIIPAGIYVAPSIMVAEAAKVVENTQRDLNISLMNELAIIFDRMGIETRDVINAASTKWNFHPYSPGLAGGHCISVDPFYLIHKARQLGHEPQVIAAGRRVNDLIPHFVAKRLIQKLLELGRDLSHTRVLIMGITFKENVADVRNSKVVDLIRELQDYSIRVDIVDPLASAQQVYEQYGIHLGEHLGPPYEAVLVAVPHDHYREYTLHHFQNLMPDHPVLFDLKGIYDFPEEDMYLWRL